MKFFNESRGKKIMKFFNQLQEKNLEIQSVAGKNLEIQSDAGKNSEIHQWVAGEKLQNLSYSHEKRPLISPVDHWKKFFLICRFKILRNRQ